MIFEFVGKIALFLKPRRARRQIKRKGVDLVQGQPLCVFMVPKPGLEPGRP